jgi:hypothetical protein
MLQRQHEDILGLRDDVQSLADGLDDDSDGWDSAGESKAVPARMRVSRHRRARLVSVRYLQADAEDEQRARKDLADTRNSTTDALAKARDAQEKLSIEANIRKADEKARIDAEGRRYRPWLCAGAALAVLAILARAWVRKRG